VTTFADYTDITTGLFVEWYIPYFSEGTTDFPVTFRFSDYTRSVEIEGEKYTPLSYLLTISPSKNQVQTSGDGLTMTLTGIEPNNYTDMRFLQNSRIEGSTVTIRRGIFGDDGNLVTLTGGNPVGRFKGFVESYTLRDSYDLGTGKSDTVLTLQIEDYKNYLTKKVTGRKTARPNRGGWLTGFEEVVPGLQSPVLQYDQSMNNVIKIAGAKFEWGKGD